GPYPGRLSQAMASLMLPGRDADKTLSSLRECSSSLATTMVSSATEESLSAVQQMRGLSSKSSSDFSAPSRRLAPPARITAVRIASSHAPRSPLEAPPEDRPWHQP